MTQVRINRYSPAYIQPEYKRVKLRARSLEERVQDANRIGTVYAIVDVVMVSLIDSYIHQAHRCATESGLMRHSMKSAMNSLLDATRTMMINAKLMDTETFMYVMFTLFPFAKKRFTEDGGGVRDEFVASFDRRSDRLVSRMHEAMMRLTAETREQHADLCAHLLMIHLLSHKGIQLYNSYAGSQNSLLAGEIVLDRRKSMHYEKYLHLTRIAMKEIGFSVEKEIPDDKYEAIDSMHKEMDELFGMDHMMKLCSEIAYKSCMTYIEYSVACLRTDLEVDGRVDDNYLKTIVTMIGKRDTGYLLRFLRRMPTPEEQGMDIWEYAQHLPDGGRSKTLDRLRRKSMAVLNQSMNS